MICFRLLIYCRIEAETVYILQATTEVDAYFPDARWFDYYTVKVKYYYNCYVGRRKLLTIVQISESFKST